MKRLARWLKSKSILQCSEEQIVLNFRCILASFLLLTLFFYFDWVGWQMELLCGILYIGGAFLPPCIAQIISLVKKKPWNPWYWMPIVVGNSVGGFLSIVTCYFTGWLF